MTDLDEPLRRVLGDKTAKVLDAKLALTTVGDLLRHYPRRYATRGDLTDLAALREGEHVTVVAEVLDRQQRTMRNRPGAIVDVTVSDGHGRLGLVFFFKSPHRMPRQIAALRKGRRGLFSGKVSEYQGRRQLAHPEFELFPDSEELGEDALAQAAEFAAELIPVYPAADGLPSWKIASAVRMVLDPLVIEQDPVPASVREKHGLLGQAEAIELIHRPREWPDVGRAKKRLKWDEALLVQVALAQRRRAATSLPARPRPAREDGLLAAFDERLPFALTEGQREVGGLLATDLAREHPMHKLLQGDVGSGKTVCALRAMLQVVDAGGQAALLAPTEVLAQQHHRSISTLLGPLAEAGRLGGAEQGTQVALLTGSQGAKARRAALLDVASGSAGIVVGTHALIQEHVQFADLGFVVVDEQHRFGVEQRDALREKAGEGRPHVLVMTATPIPRTVAMTVYGDLDTVVLGQLPVGRSPIATHVVPAAERPRYLERAWERIREEVEKGHQAYIVCPRIGEGGDGDGEAGSAPPEDGERRPPLAVTDVAPMLTDGPLKGLKVGVLHGRMHPDEKDTAMRAFASGETDVLVATTVVEVGVDVPNAAVMVIMDADRFGVSQLHQLRGRVGRGSVPGLTLLVTEAPEGTPARERLDAVAGTTDGFALSRVDLEQRREGDVLGAAQAGRRSHLRMLTLVADEDLIKAARGAATELVEADPELTGHPALAAALAGLLDDERTDYLEKT